MNATLRPGLWRDQSILVEPLQELGGNEFVVSQLWISKTDAIDLLGLARRQILVRIEAKCVRQQPPAAKHLVDAWDAAGKPVGCIKHRSVEVGEVSSESEQRHWNSISRATTLTFVKETNGKTRSARPLAQESPNYVHASNALRRGHGVSSQ